MFRKPNSSRPVRTGPIPPACQLGRHVFPANPADLHCLHCDATRPSAGGKAAGSGAPVHRQVSPVPKSWDHEPQLMVDGDIESGVPRQPWRKPHGYTRAMRVEYKLCLLVLALAALALVVGCAVQLSGGVQAVDISEMKRE